MSQIDSTEARLTTHEQVCAERYKGIEIRMSAIDLRFDKVEAEIRLVKESTTKGFAEIKDLIEKRNNSSHTAIITSAGSVIVALIAFLGYLLTHAK